MAVTILNAIVATIGVARSVRTHLRDWLIGGGVTIVETASDMSNIYESGSNHRGVIAVTIMWSKKVK